jgi:PHD/YefM family antitoxin component YafN of YafNO toxin-antitoxin module
VNRAEFKGERIILYRRGKKAAALVPIEDLELIEAIEDRIDIEESKKAMAEARKKGTIPWRKIKKELGL